VLDPPQYSPDLFVIEPAPKYVIESTLPCIEYVKSAVVVVESSISASFRSRSMESPYRRIRRSRIGAVYDLSTERQQMVLNPNDLAAREAYNFAVAGVFGTIKEAKLDPWTQPLRVPAPAFHSIDFCRGSYHYG
jgi:hypothetical protein